MIRPKSIAEIEAMRHGGKQLAQILNLLAYKVLPDVNGLEIDTLAASEIKTRGLKPILKGYHGFPATICISVNEAVVHGIPSSEPFKDGDLVKLDLSIEHEKMTVDAALTVVVGQARNADARRLVEGAKKSLEAGIAAISGDGTHVGDISAAVQDVLGKYKLGVVRDLVGHGVGHGVHEAPEVPNYGSSGGGPVLPAGATIAIEPMATLGDWQVAMKPDGWTVITQDGSLAAHFEHTVLITETGAEILTSL